MFTYGRVKGGPWREEVIVGSSSYLSKEVVDYQCVFWFGQFIVYLCEQFHRCAFFQGEDYHGGRYQRDGLGDDSLAECAYCLGLAIRGIRRTVTGDRPRSISKEGAVFILRFGVIRCLVTIRCLN